MWLASTRVSLEWSAALCYLDRPPRRRHVEVAAGVASSDPVAAYWTASLRSQRRAPETDYFFASWLYALLNRANASSVSRSVFSSFGSLLPDTFATARSWRHVQRLASRGA